MCGLIRAVQHPELHVFRAHGKTLPNRFLPPIYMIMHEEFDDAKCKSDAQWNTKAEHDRETQKGVQPRMHQTAGMPIATLVQHHVGRLQKIVRQDVFELQCNESNDESFNSCDCDACSYMRGSGQPRGLL